MLGFSYGVKGEKALTIRQSETSLKKSLRQFVLYFEWTIVNFYTNSFRTLIEAVGSYRVSDATLTLILSKVTSGHGLLIKPYTDKCGKLQQHCTSSSNFKTLRTWLDCRTAPIIFRLEFTDYKQICYINHTNLDHGDAVMKNNNECEWNSSTYQTQFYHIVQDSIHSHVNQLISVALPVYSKLHIWLCAPANRIIHCCPFCLVLKCGHTPLVQEAGSNVMIYRASS